MTDCSFLFKSKAKVSIVIPAYNEEERILPLLQSLGSIQTPVEDIELIIVDDGSSDRTGELCRREIENRFPRGELITLDNNSGKGNALRVGVAAVSSSTVITMDADMATDLSAMGPAIHGLKKHHIVVGSRSIEGSQTEGISRMRRCITIGFSFFLRALTRHKILDTQCGFKAYRSPVAKVLFGSSTVKGFSQDAEILDLAYRHNFSILEIPVHWRSVPGSKVNIVRDSLTSFFEFVWYRLNASRRQSVTGVTLRRSKGQSLILESEVIDFFPPESIFVQCRSVVDILMPGIDRAEIQKTAEAFHQKYPDHEISICRRTFSELSSIKN